MNTMNTIYQERTRNQRSTTGITEAQFERAHIISTRKLASAVTVHVAIRDLQVVEIYAMPQGALEWFNTERNERPETFA